jgi:hypothetical protein
MTQQNAALVEESAAAAESLRSQAAHLAEAVGTFRLAETATATGGMDGQARGRSARPAPVKKAPVAATPKAARQPRSEAPVAPVDAARQAGRAIGSSGRAPARRAARAMSAAHEDDWETF